MSGHICTFCLGDSLDAPVFGSYKDARDFVSPCSSCSLVTHRKCLIDWFQSLQESQLLQQNTRDQSIALVQPGAPDVDTDDNDTGFINFTNNARVVAYLRLDPTFRPRLSSAQQNRAPCPQCKTPIVFEMGELSLINFYEYARSAIYDFVYYGSISMCLSGAALGILIIAYRTLAQCGTSIINVIKPSSVLFFELGGTKLTWSNVVVRPVLVLLGDYPKSKLQAVPLPRFDYVPALPFIMYRMGTLLIFDILLNRKAFSLVNIINEVQVCRYFSSLGGHVLAKQLWRNAAVAVFLQLRSGKMAWTSFSLAYLTRNINWWDPNVMVGCIVPARWAYDLLYRLVINRIFFDITASVEPRRVVNSMSGADGDRLEMLTLQLTQAQADLNLRLRKRMGHKNIRSGLLRNCVSALSYIGDKLFLKIIRIKILLWLQKTKVCMLHDYSHSLFSHLIVVCAVSTLVWPFISADLGKIIFHVISKKPSFALVEPGKVVFLSNLVAMAVVALLRDLGRLVLCRVKANQVSTINIIKVRRASTPERSDSSHFPGAFVH
ncbi:hypothetical protein METBISCDRAFT_16568 [Metschnikowia bicuspidata]|uniref:Uncharacterized protein n=1 Tax=Metschnikowia bicuspidata TaxID=27322 RepID=A0A4P9ZBS5_9ASCO|nr:hypothetical protein METBISCDRAFT_16568 [Metschnikowia bicuspidata]